MPETAKYLKHAYDRRFAVLQKLIKTKMLIEEEIIKKSKEILPLKRTIDRIEGGFNCL